jgi:hypothetical protein
MPARCFNSAPYDVVLQHFGWVMDILDADVFTGTKAR